jgi:hypothetical protein
MFFEPSSYLYLHYTLGLWLLWTPCMNIVILGSPELSSSLDLRANQGCNQPIWISMIIFS